MSIVIHHNPACGTSCNVLAIIEASGETPMHLSRLTERFYRVDDHHPREKGGTGPGLAIVKHIVSRHRGWLAVGLGQCRHVLACGEARQTVEGPRHSRMLWSRHA